MARRGPQEMSATRSLSGINRTSRGQANSVENDPTADFRYIASAARCWPVSTLSGLIWNGTTSAVLSYITAPSLAFIGDCEFRAEWHSGELSRLHHRPRRPFPWRRNLERMYRR